MKKIFIALIATLLAFTVQAGEKEKQASNNDSKSWSYRVGAGYLIGGTAPLPLPAEIRAIKGFNPGLNFSIEGSAHKRFKNTGWGIQFGVRVDSKGMTTDAKTKNYHMEINNADGSRIVGSWTGMVKTHVSNTYLSVPVLATYSIGKRWTVAAGAYASYLIKGEFTGEAYDGYIREGDPTGEKTEVSSAPYDFSKDIVKFHWGVQAGAECKVVTDLGVFANLQWGLNGIFPKNYSCVPFALTPIYATIGINYIF